MSLYTKIITHLSTLVKYGGLTAIFGRFLLLVLPGVVTITTNSLTTLRTVWFTS